MAHPLRSQVLVLAVAALLAALAGCSRPAAGTAPALEVRRGSFRERVLLTGEVKATRTTSIAVPQLPGWQSGIRWMVADGTSVKAGDKVVELDASSFARDLDRLRLAVARARNDELRSGAEVEARVAEKAAEVERRRTALAKAVSNAEVPAELLPLRERQERELALERARIGLEKAESEHRAERDGADAERKVKRIARDKAERERRTAEAGAELAVLRAPRDGLVLIDRHRWEGRKLQVGDVVWVGMTVATLPDLSAMAIEASLPDVDDGRIDPGLPARVTLDAWPALEFSGRVSEISPIAAEPGKQSLRRAFRVRIELERVDPERMRPGMSVRVEVETRRLADVLLAPRAGLDLAAEPPRARVAGGASPELRIGPCNATECVVESGIEAGVQLVAESGR